MPIPDSVLPQEPPDRDNNLWFRCPSCGGSEWTIAHGLQGPWSIQQVCCECGYIDDLDLHWTAERREMEVAA